MDLHRIATRVAARFTVAAEPEAMAGIHGLVKGLRGGISQAQQIVDLVGGTELVGPEMDKVNQQLSGFASKWGPQVEKLSAEASQLARTVGDAVVRNRRGRTRG